MSTAHLERARPYCYQCGAPLPWTRQALHAIEELAREDSDLSDDEGYATSRCRTTSRDAVTGAEKAEVSIVVRSVAVAVTVVAPESASGSLRSMVAAPLASVVTVLAPMNRSPWPAGTAALLAKNSIWNSRFGVLSKAPTIRVVTPATTRVNSGPLGPTGEPVEKRLHLPDRSSIRVMLRSKARGRAQARGCAVRGAESGCRCRQVLLSGSGEIRVRDLGRQPQAGAIGRVAKGRRP